MDKRTNMLLKYFGEFLVHRRLSLDWEFDIRPARNGARLMWQG